MILITKKLEFDSGHRIPNHSGKCRNIHGHRYVIEITLKGDLSNSNQESDSGMLMDFSDVKDIANKHIVSLWDHGFLVYCEDYIILDFLKTIPEHKTVILDRIPTAENLSLIAYKILFPIYYRIYNKTLTLHKVRIYETPNCWAEYSGD